MRRFERLYAKPSHSWELAIEGSTVRTRETAGGEVTEATADHASAAAAQAAADALIAARRAAGFVEIKRVAAYLDEASVARRQRFEWIEGYVARYCELVQADRTVTRTAGMVDVGGRERPATPHREKFVQIAQASARFDEIARELAGTVAAAEDLRETISADAETAIDPAIFAACRDDDATTWAVCADWLADRGDPRGTIAGLALGGRLEDAHGAIAVAYPGLDAAVTLRHGFVRELAVHGGSASELARSLATALDAPLSVFVDELAFTITRETPNVIDWAPVLDTVIARPHARRLRRLAFSTTTYEVPDEHGAVEARGRLRSLAFAWPALPALTELVIDSGASGNLTGSSLPALRRLERRANVLPLSDLVAITSAAWPALEELELWLGAHGGITLAHLAPILDGVRLPKLGHLGLVNSDLADELVEALAHAPILPRLHSLDLSRGTLGDVGAAALARHAVRFRHLAMIDLDNNLLSERAVAEVRAVLDNVVTGAQREDIYDERYVSTGE